MELNSRINLKTSGRNIGRRNFMAWTASVTLLGATLRTSRAESNADRIVVLTFDDAVKTHRTEVAPLLKQLGFGATFFVTHRWMVDDPEHYLTWQEIAEMHQMGFEIGSHSWTHPDFSTPRNAARLPAELALVECELRKVGVPRPISLAYCGDHWGPEAIQQVTEIGYKLARRGSQPEVPVEDTSKAQGRPEDGPPFDPLKNHHLLIPSAGVPVPGWTMERFRRVADLARPGQIVVFEIHGVPDPHAFASTTPELFEQSMAYLKEQGFRVVSLRDVQEKIPKTPPKDPLLDFRNSGTIQPTLELPAEMAATRAELAYWLMNMIQHHRYTWTEVDKVAGLGIEVLKNRTKEMDINGGSPPEPTGIDNSVRAMPYPGGRHPRIGFLEVAICPMRGTKASVFLPWDPASYVVIDLPEAIFSNLGLTFLAHTDIPTIWDEQNIWLENIDWIRDPENGSLTGSRVLPNKIAFGSSVQPSSGMVEMELWLRNDTSEKLSGLRTQICVMLKGAPEFNSQINDNKIFKSPVSAVKSAKGDRWILVAWDRCGRAWGNAPVPCMHADPVLADCVPGETVRVRGRLWFYEGSDIDGEVNRAQRTFAALHVGG
jgi:peptidoglycan/xylan/chitin deacetylase (PgdA/CDA1 family)